MVHSRHLHTPCMECDSRARNTSSRSPPDQKIWSGSANIFCGRRGYILHKAFQLVGYYSVCKYQISLQDSGDWSKAMATVNYKAAVRQRRNKFEISRRDSAQSLKRIGWVMRSRLCSSSKGWSCELLALAPPKPAQYFSAKKAATPARIQTLGRTSRSQWIITLGMILQWGGLLL